MIFWSLLLFLFTIVTLTESLPNPNIARQIEVILEAQGKSDKQESLSRRDLGTLLEVILRAQGQPDIQESLSRRDLGTLLASVQGWNFNGLSLSQLVTKTEPQALATWANDGIKHLTERGCSPFSEFCRSPLKTCWPQT